MTDISIDDDGNVIEEEKEIKRNAKGRFVKGHSGNLNGRAGKKGKASSNKLNKTKMITAMNKEMFKAINAIVRIGEKAEKSGQLATALKASATILSEGTKLLAQQERLLAEANKLSKSLEDEEDDKAPELGRAILRLTSNTGT